MIPGVAMGCGYCSGSTPQGGSGILSAGLEVFVQVPAAGFGCDFGGRKNERAGVNLERLAFHFV